MPGKMSLRNARSVLAAEVDGIRRRDPDFDAGDITLFTFPLLVRAVGVLAIGVVPLLVVRSDSEEDALLVPLIGSLALVIICTAIVAWLTSVVISGLVVMILYRTGPRASSRLVTRILTDSFRRVGDSSSHLTLLALVAGLLSLAIGLPTRRGDELANSVIEDLLAAQVGVLLAVLGFAFIAESIRSAADIVDDQSLMLAWPWALIIACVSWSVATLIGPFETTRMLTILLNEWLPAFVDGVPRAMMIADLVPPGARWWAALGPLPVIALVWVIQAWRHEGFIRIREFLEGDDEVPPTRLA
ncbi:hypothetical protein MCHIJ_43120 [Mycolicibacterium chitae]|uniref:Uncharacterized protein n=1 Tax=Mycolicibacterium chitae TaxID=1792 RepID=A0A3S4RHQ1_MYCCI|nr:hypothetical protein [Mycolicibacterium chitae]MCV7104206.1 hypothetical protein [Mycolicibacterium chitae]BBZ04875.1 hypothetical protein MCHIJ_43120 [Mycolicibacterium chitae]VEG48499.1 Uncharacterised protein [Mycolicibacterium chitae]